MSKRFLIDQRGKIIPVKKEEPITIRRKDLPRGNGVGTGTGFINISKSEKRKLDLQNRKLTEKEEDVKIPKIADGKVLVIIPAYNAELTIFDSVNSVLKQTYENLLVVVINDCSTDKTEEILNSIKDKRLIILKNEENIGTYLSINKAFINRLSDFDFFLIHGSDDLMHAQKLEIQLKEFIDGILAVSSGYQRIDHNTKEIISKYTSGESMIIYSKKVFEKIGYYDNTRFGGDTEYRDRFLLIFGREKLKETYIILSDCLIGEWNLTKKIDRNSRIIYKNNYAKKHLSFKKFKNFEKYKSGIKGHIKSILVSFGDFAGSGEKIKNAIRKYNPQIEIYSLVKKSHKFGYGSDFLIDNLKDSEIETVQNYINDCDIIHFKGDDLPKFNWFGINLPKNKKTIITVGGSGFRRGNSKVAFEWYPIEEYINLTDFRSCITPDLNYPEFKSTYTPHAYDTKKQSYCWEDKPKLTIQHSPSSRGKKGTNDIILPVLESLSKKYEIEIDLIENVSNKECIKRKKNGSIFIDQISETGFYGMSAIESMQYGIPVVAYISESSIKQSEEKLENCPIIICKNSLELEKKLTHLIENREDLKKISIETKKYTDRLHSYESVGKIWSTIYENLCSK
jgi:glycosyltransferase involved in cell wall biosynthesis